jgi:hypothetical protein
MRKSGNLLLASLSEGDAAALRPLEAARAMPHGPDRSVALKQAGDLRNAADRVGLVSQNGGGPEKA